MKAGVLWVGVLLLIAVASAVAVTYARQQSRQLFVELTRLETARDELNIDFGRLQIEQATWAGNPRVEKVARGELGMVFPVPTETRVVRP